MFICFAVSQSGGGGGGSKIKMTGISVVSLSGGVGRGVQISRRVFRPNSHIKAVKLSLRVPSEEMKIIILFCWKLIRK